MSANSRLGSMLSLALLSASSAWASVQGSAVTHSTHAAQIVELGECAHPATDDDAEARRLAQRARTSTLRVPATRDDDFVVFGYLQSETQVYHLRWHALTHVGSRFVGFNALGQLTNVGNFTARSSYLRAGGAAEAAGVEVVLVLANFDDSPGGSLEAVMTSPARRATLVSQLVGVLAQDDYSHGVSLDFEFSWGPAVRDGVTAFARELRQGLDSLGAGHELSIYTNAIFSASQWDFDAQTGLTPHIDYMLYSMYDWASGSVAKAISDYDSCLANGRMIAYLDDGLPPQKLVPVISAYSRRWTGATTYGGVGSSAASSGFTDALFDVTLNPGLASFAGGYVRGDEAQWYRWNDGQWRTRTFEGLDGFEVEVRQVLSLQDPSGRWNGRRLGGVGFWSLMWMAEFDSVDPRTGGAVARTRTYPHVYQLCHEALGPRGGGPRTLETFAGLDFRWRDPNESPDTRGDVDGDSRRTLVASPSGVGNALRFDFDFEGQTNNRAVLAHEVLASPLAPSVADTNAVLGRFPATSAIEVRVHSASPAPAYRARLVVIDALGQLEASPQFPLGLVGPRTLRWDLTNPAQVFPYSTAEPALASGDGLLASGATGSDDIAFYGVVVEGNGPGAGQLVIDSIAFERTDPGGRDYRINEFRYADSDTEFVEISGPSGPLPIGLTLRVYDGADGSVAAALPVSGTMPNDGGGRGRFVVGDPGVPEVDLATFFASNRDDLPNADPSALQLVDAFTGHVYDSVVYEAFGGLDELVRRETLGVTSHGWPWLGEVGPGGDEAGAGYTFGRYPDGHDSQVNGVDFSFQRATPGEANGAALGVTSAFDFEAPHAAVFQTYDRVRRVDPQTASLPSSPGGGRAWRVVDAAGGGVIGVIGVIGDEALGREFGLRARGELYVPASSAPAQAVAVGICGTQGSTFFSSTAEDRSGYESGYWLIYENRSGIGLADGRADHAGTWEFVWASHDNMDGERVQLLGSATDAQLGLTPGAWVKFELTLKPDGTGGGSLAARVGGRSVFAGRVPEGAPLSGAFQVGFRENHAGPPGPGEGTWVDSLTLEPVLPSTDG